MIEGDQATNDSEQKELLHHAVTSLRQLRMFTASAAAAAAAAAMQ